MVRSGFGRIAIWAGRGTALAGFLGFCFTAAPLASAQQLPWSQRTANATMARWPNGRFVPPDAKWGWNYELATLLNGMDAAWYDSAKGAYFQYTKASVDSLLGPDGSIPTYDPSARSLDEVAMGRQLLLLYGVTQDVKYYKAATLLRKQLEAQPHNASGGFWHKGIYPDQMWLDGLYMAEPFYAQYAAMFQEPQDFAQITRQFSLVEEHTRSPKTGLLYHAWDESKKQPWADKETGTSHVFWARAMGWYMMALVDSLAYYPKDDPGRATLLAILNRTAAAIVPYQDKKTGLWYEVLDKPAGKGNYFEASANCMFTYALQKGVRLGYLPEHYSKNAASGWQGILSHFVQTDTDGGVTITGTVKAIGLGGTPYRDGSYEYYVNAPVVNNDPKGVGVFLLAGTEMERAAEATDARGQTVMIDAWFNSQQRVNAAGEKEYFHYKWSDYTNDGFTLYGHIWQSHGASLDTLYTAPTVEKLKAAQYYVIASPDIPVKNPNPHYAQPEDADQVAKWVEQGGVLILMENDPGNADIDHLDLIADRFGIHFNNALSHHVVGEDLASGMISVGSGNSIFHEAHNLYMKDTSTISVKNGATPVLIDKGDILMATARYGKGRVFAVVDPWVYNEYTDGRKKAPITDNFIGGKELVRWLIQQQHHEADAAKPE